MTAEQVVTDPRIAIERYEVVPIDSVQPHPRNIRHSDLRRAGRRERPSQMTRPARWTPGHSWPMHLPARLPPLAPEAQST